MERDQAQQVLAYLAGAYPTAQVDAATVAVFAEELDRWPYMTGKRAAERVAREQPDRFPSLGQMVKVLQAQARDDVKRTPNAPETCPDCAGAGYGFRIQEDGSAAPCADCNPETHDRWAAGDFTLDPDRRMDRATVTAIAGVRSARQRGRSKRPTPDTDRRTPTDAERFIPPDPRPGPG